MRTLPFVPPAETVFIAGISDRQLNRVVEEQLVPDELLDLKGSTRRYARLVAPLARFYFETELTLVAAARRDIVRELFRRVQEVRAPDSIWALTEMPVDFNWKVSKPGIEIDMLRFFVQAYTNARKVDEAESLVTEDPTVMGGLPCFAGTRVPIDIVLGALAEGMTQEQLRQDYPFLTSTHIAAARVYTEVHPRRGRPRRLGKVLGQPRKSITVDSTRT